jgi:diguanylate cyclase (GGDEF)-like protein/PAS domain S-box-containing protein
MRPAPHLFDEEARLASLAEYELVDTDKRIDLNDVVELAVRLFDVPIVLVSVMARERQFVKASAGIDLCELDRRHSFCAHTIDRPDIMIVPDATLDVRFAANPFVTGEPHLRFYAGIALRAPDGQAIGSMCLIDRRPRRGLTETEQANLRSVAQLVLDKLEMRRLAVAGAAGQTRFENIASTSPDGIICADEHGVVTFWNAAAERLFGFAPDEAVGRPIDIIVPPRMRGGHGGGLRRVAEGGKPRLVGSTVELDAVHAEGGEFPIELSLAMWREHGSAAFGAIIRDITERRANEERLFALAHLDSLTGLANRGVLSRRIMECIATTDRAAVLLIDLDGFKDINDTLGHSTGDAVLREISRRIGECSRPIDTVARLGGDEFAVLLPCSPDRQTVGLEADCLIARIAEPILLDGRTIHVSASIGIAAFPDDGAHAEDLLSAADLALYQAKNEGRNCRRFFSPALREAAHSRRAFEGEVRRAVASGEFELFYQPQVRIADGVLIGVEALLRWRHPTHGLLAPDRFLAAVEASAQAADVGHWVLERACRDLVALRRSHPALTVGVNLFGTQFRDGRLADGVRATLRRFDLPPDALELEITENIILRRDETMLGALQELRAIGVGIAFDDFGTGFASLSLLKQYPLSRIKIDRSFVAGICTDPVDAAIVTATIHIAQAMRIEVVGEGIETVAQRDCLRALGCGVAQGFLYGRPVSFDVLATMLAGVEDAAA